MVIESPDMPIVFTAKYREFGLQIMDGGSSCIRLGFCPWCGQKFPTSLRDAWFDELEKREIDPYAENIPAEFSDHRWYSHDK